MSEAYNFSFKIDLKCDLSSGEIKALEFLMGASDHSPAMLPDHQLYSDGLPDLSFLGQYRDFPLESYTFNSWLEHSRNGEITRRAIDLYFPSQAFEDIYQDCLPLAAWLASLSVKNGFAGSFSLSDSEDFNPTLLFVSDGEIYIGTAAKAHSFLTGQELIRG